MGAARRGDCSRIPEAKSTAQFSLYAPADAPRGGTGAISQVAMYTVTCENAASWPAGMHGVCSTAW